MAGGLGNGTTGLLRRPYHVGNLQLLPAELNFSLAYACDIEEIVDEADQVNELPVHRLFDLSDIGCIGATTQDIEAVPERCKRISEFVRQGREKFVLATIGFLECVGL